jgi:GT2 family glycosyltransferase
VNVRDLTVGITTRDRPDALRRCVQSLRHLAHLAPEVIVFDDASRQPAVDQLRDLDPALRLRVVRDDASVGYIAGRNRLVREAAAPFVLLLDDDTALLDGRAVESGLAVLRHDPRAGAVALAQARADGSPWPDGLQPAAIGSPAVVPAFIGFAHLVRRSLFLELGGYRERFVFYGEEKELCIRLMDAGYRTVFLPSAYVVHDPDPRGRSSSRYLRYVVRNDCLNAMYNEPAHRMLWLLPARMTLYFVMRREWKVTDPFGWLWILRELLVNAGPVFRDRRPVGSGTRRRWAALRKQPESYEVPRAPVAS